MSVIKLAASTDIPRHKACVTCRYLQDKRVDPTFWKCGVSGLYVATERQVGDCGSEKFLWEPRPIQPPGFWARLGDALIERIRGKR